MKNNMLMVSVFFILAGIAEVLLLSRTITGPINQTVNMLKDLSEGEGDLTGRLSDASRDEIGDMARYFNRFIEKLYGVVASIVENTDHVSRSSDEMTQVSVSFAENAQNQAAVAEEVSATIEQISAGVETIAMNSADQYNRLGSFIEQMHKLSESISVMNTKLQETAAITEEIAVTAKSGESSLNSMNDSMNRITGSSREMVGIVGMINDISEQINLLSLNAAIEAARAGDAGRGFAVVADEISKLADQTASSIKDINRFISANNHEITMGMDNVNSAIETISIIMSGVSRVGEMMQGLELFMNDQLESNTAINQHAHDMRNRAGEMKNATEEQKNAIEEIVKSVTNINEYTQSNAAGAVKMSDSAENTSNMADNLKKAVGYFKI